MRTWRRRTLVLFAVVLTFASISASCGRTMTITDMQGAPIAGAYVVYHYEGRTLALAESLTYQASPIAVAQSDADGHVSIAPILRMHWPLLQGAPKLTIGLIYAPPLHNGLASVNRGVAVSRQQEYDVSADLETVRIADVSTDPVRWENTLRNLSSLLDYLTSREMRGEAVPPLTPQLLEQFTREYAAMLDRWGESARARPAMPEALKSASDHEKREWQAMVDKDLAARPRWKDELERAFGTQVRQVQRR
jgi:hypothetical protein